MDKLKPCPFCGGEAHTYKNSLWHVACERALHGCVTMSAFLTEADAIAAWNTRAERTCENIDEFADGGFFICGNCGFGEDDIELTPNYCPNCGAKVVKE